ncbi:lectin [Rhodoplanes sp. SY1]|uniref:lectin n=1 Tax=Rhodoplanes sp. SY1 TaxID=3166646 RepID=UPI0038B451C3
MRNAPSWSAISRDGFRIGAGAAPAALAIAVGLAVPAPAVAQQAGAMTFFVTSQGPGKGGDLGGLAGADRHCQTLAQAAGAGDKTWRAYLSTQAADGAPAVNARDRIGRGPWSNAKGVVIAKDVDDLHGPSNNLTKQTALSEKGEVINGRGDTPNRHDILTGSQADGRAFPSGEDRTCRNWTSSTTGAAMVGHSDRTGLDDSAPAKSWNTSHPSRGPGGGCTQADLRSTGGDGLLYCFAVN